MRFWLFIFICSHHCAWITNATNGIGITLEILDSGDAKVLAEKTAEFLRDVDNKSLVGQLMNLHYYDFLNDENEEQFRHARMEMAVTVHIYLLSQWNKGPEFRQMLDTKLYSQWGLCTLVYVRTSYMILQWNKEHPEAKKKSTANPCDKNELKQQEFLHTNEALVQEAIFQVLKANFMKPKTGTIPPFLKHLSSMMSEASDEGKHLLQQKFEHLFGRPRLYILLGTTYQLFNPFFVDNHETQCLIDFFKTENMHIVDIWRYIYVINFNVYNDWWKKEEPNFDRLKDYWIISLMELIFDRKNYWDEEYNLRESFKVANTPSALGVPKMMDPNFEFEEMKTLFFDTAVYAKRELEEIPSFLEAMRLCTEMERAKHAAEIEKKAVEAAGTSTDTEGNIGLQQKTSKPYMVTCIRVKLTKENDQIVTENRGRQRQLRQEKLLDILDTHVELMQLTGKENNNAKLVYLTDHTTKELQHERVKKFARDLEADEKADNKREMERRRVQSERFQKHERTPVILQDAEDSKAITIVFVEGTEMDTRAEFLHNVRRDSLAVSEATVKRLIDIQYTEYLKTENTHAMDYRRNMLAITTHIFFLYKYAGEMKAGKLDPLLNGMEDMYSLVALAELIKLRKAYANKNWQNHQIQYSEENRKNDKKLFKDNEMIIAESIYQAILMLAWSEESEWIKELSVQTEKAIAEKDSKLLLLNKITFLFGYSNHYKIFELYYGIKDLYNKNDEKLLLDCLEKYFTHADNVVEQWRYIFSINFYVYNQWHDSEKDKFVQYLPQVAIDKFNYIFEEKNYWHGDRFMWRYVNIMHNLKLVTFHEAMIKTSTNNDVGEIFFDLPKYAKKELFNSNTYVEAMRKCVLTLKLKKVAKKNQDKEWNDCMNEQKDKNTKMNISLQQQMRKEKLLLLFKEKPELEQLARQSPNAVEKLELLANYKWVTSKKNEFDNQRGSTSGISEKHVVAESAGRETEDIKHETDEGQSAHAVEVEKYEVKRKQKMGKHEEEHQTIQLSPYAKLILNYDDEEGKETASTGLAESIEFKEARAAFLHTPSAQAFHRLFDIQYLQFLEINTNDPVLMDPHRLMMAITTHIYFFHKYANEKLITEVLSPLLEYMNLRVYTPHGLCELINIRNGYDDKGDWAQEGFRIHLNEYDKEKCRKLLAENVHAIQETLFQVTFMLPSIDDWKASTEITRQIEQAKTDEKVKESFFTKVRHLFGDSNFYKIIELNGEMKQIYERTNEQLLLECFEKYFTHGDNVVDQWRYIYSINFYTYNQWQQNEPNIAKLPQEAVAQFKHIFEQNSYWQGDKYMAGYVNRMHLKEAEADGVLGRLVEAIKRENAKEIFFDFIKYSKGQLTGTSAYVEAMRECFSALWDDATQSLKRLNKNEWKTPPKEWVDCVELKLESVQKNILAQKEFRKIKLLELCEQNPALKQMASNTLNAKKLILLTNYKWKDIWKKDGSKKMIASDAASTKTVSNVAPSAAVAVAEVSSSKKSAKKRRDKNNKGASSSSPAIRSPFQEEILKPTEPVGMQTTKDGEEVAQSVSAQIKAIGKAEVEKEEDKRQTGKEDKPPATGGEKMPMDEAKISEHKEMENKPTIPEGKKVDENPTEGSGTNVDKNVGADDKKKDAVGSSDSTKTLLIQEPSVRPAFSEGAHTKSHVSQGTKTTISKVKSIMPSVASIGVVIGTKKVSASANKSQSAKRWEQRGKKQETIPVKEKIPKKDKSNELKQNIDVSGHKEGKDQMPESNPELVGMPKEGAEDVQNLDEHAKKDTTTIKSQLTTVKSKSAGKDETGKNVEKNKAATSEKSDELTVDIIGHVKMPNPADATLSTNENAEPKPETQLDAMKEKPIIPKIGQLSLAEPIMHKGGNIPADLGHLQFGTVPMGSLVSSEVTSYGKVSPPRQKTGSSKAAVVGRSDQGGKDIPIPHHKEVTAAGDDKDKDKETTLKLEGKQTLESEGKQIVDEGVKGGRSAKGEGTTIQILQREKAKEAEEKKKLMYAKELAMRGKFENLFIKMNELGQIADVYEEDGLPKSFDTILEELYESYFEEENNYRKDQIELLADISAMVWMIEEKLRVAQMLTEKRDFDEIEQIAVDGFKGKWHEFKWHHFTTPAFEAGNKLNELMAQIFPHYLQLYSLPTEIVDGNNEAVGNNEFKKEQILAQIHIRTLCQVLLAKNGSQTSSKRLLRLKNDLLKGGIIVEPIFRKLNRLVASGYTNIKTKENLRALLMDTTELRVQIDFEMKLRYAMNGMHKGWLNPEYFEYTQPIHSNIIIGAKPDMHDTALTALLAYNYPFDEHTNYQRKMEVKNHVRDLMNQWLRAVKHASEFLLCLGGSTMLGSNDQNTDMDIIAIFPQITVGTSDPFFGENGNSVFKHLKSNKFHRANKIPGRIPLIRLFYESPSYGTIQIDLTFVMLPYHSFRGHINPNTHLESYENIAVIDGNVKLMETLIDGMCKHLNSQNQSGILVLSSYLFLYRLKYKKIKWHQLGNFIHLLQAVKLWAKSKHIYSNVLGYLSGTSLTIMAAKICLLYPNGDLKFLLEKFFHTFSMWEWPRPLLLDQWSGRKCGNEKVWQPMQIHEQSEQMPIVLSQFPETNTAFNVNEVSKKVIQKTFKKAYGLMKKRRSLKWMARNDFWELQIFSKAKYEIDYDSYFLLLCSARGNKNWESKCGSAKWSLRKEFNNWWETGTFKFDAAGENMAVQQYLDMYHIFTGFEQRGIRNYKGEECMAWIVGVNFNSKNGILTEEQREKLIKSFEWRNVSNKEIVDIYYGLKYEAIETKMDGIFKEVYGSPSAVSAYQVTYSPPHQQQFGTGVFTLGNYAGNISPEHYSNLSYNIPAYSHPNQPVFLGSPPRNPAIRSPSQHGRRSQNPQSHAIYQSPRGVDRGPRGRGQQHHPSPRPYHHGSEGILGSPSASSSQDPLTTQGSGSSSPARGLPSLPPQSENPDLATQGLDSADSHISTHKKDSQI